MFKIWRSQYSRYGHSPEAENELYAETYTADATYTDEELKYISDGGFNGIWLNMLLHNVVYNEAFPEFGLYAKEQQENDHTSFFHEMHLHTGIDERKSCIVP